MSKKNKNFLNNKQKIIKITILIFFTSLMVFSGYKIIRYIIDTNRNKQVIEEVNNSVNIDESKQEEEKYDVDFENLKQTNSDTVAYLFVNGTQIKYPVVRGEDNSYYLNHNFNSEYNSGGWIFADYRNKFDGTDKNIIIYGHNMKNGTMFADLKDSLNIDWINTKGNGKIALVTESETWIYEVFSIYDIEVEDYYITTSFEDNNEFESYIKTMKSRSAYDFGKEVNANDSVLTLSTCSTSNRRVVMQAKRVK